MKKIKRFIIGVMVKCSEAILNKYKHEWFFCSTKHNADGEVVEYIQTAPDGHVVKSLKRLEKGPHVSTITCWKKRVA